MSSERGQVCGQPRLFHYLLPTVVVVVAVSNAVAGDWWAVAQGVGVVVVWAGVLKLLEAIAKRRGVYIDE